MEHAGNGKSAALPGEPRKRGSWLAGAVAVNSGGRRQNGFRGVPHRTIGLEVESIHQVELHASDVRTQAEPYDADKVFIAMDVNHN